MRATMYGWLIVWPPPMGSGWSSYARSASPPKTKASRGTAPIAASTRSSLMLRLRSCSATIRARAPIRRARISSIAGGQLADGLGEGSAEAGAADAEAAGDADGASETVTDADGDALATGDAVTPGVGLGVARAWVMNPRLPSSIPLSRITTNTSVTPMTNTADARSVMWTASSATDGAAATGLAASRPRLLRRDGAAGATAGSGSGSANGAPVSATGVRRLVGARRARLRAPARLLPPYRRRSRRLRAIGLGVLVAGSVSSVAVSGPVSVSGSRS